MKIITTNKKARQRFKVLETVEAGLKLYGAEIKSIRGGRVSLGSSYVTIIRGNAYIVGMRIDPYSKAPATAFEPERRRRLLLKKSQIARLIGLNAQKGMTLVPLSLYLRRGLAKVQLGVCKGKGKRDRREELRKEAMKRDAEQAIKEQHR